MHPHQIRAELIRNKIENKLIAQNLGVCDEVVSRVIHRKRTSKRIQAYIADLISLPFDHVWKPINN